MAQGPPKKSVLTKKSSVSKRSNASNPKKGARTIAPKRKKLIDQKRLTKKYSAGLIKKTEQSLAEKAGHLEMLSGGKKSKKEALRQNSKGKEP